MCWVSFFPVWVNVCEWVVKNYKEGFFIKFYINYSSGFGHQMKLIYFPVLLCFSLPIFFLPIPPYSSSSLSISFLPSPFLIFLSLPIISSLPLHLVFGVYEEENHLIFYVCEFPVNEKNNNDDRKYKGRSNESHSNQPILYVFVGV